mgnify:CR=1 FL=1
MPELPDVTLYIEHLARRIVGATLVRAQVVSSHLLRSAESPLEAAHRARRAACSASASIVWTMDSGLCLVIHLMIAGRFHWKDASAKPPAKRAERSGSRRSSSAPGTPMLTGGAARRSARRCTSWRARRDARALDPGGIEACFDSSLRGLSRGHSRAREPHAQTGAHGPSSIERHRQRVLRRDPSSREALAAQAGAAADGRGARPFARGHQEHARRVDRSSPSGNGR